MLCSLVVCVKRKGLFLISGLKIYMLMRAANYYALKVLLNVGKDVD